MRSLLISACILALVAAAPAGAVVSVSYDSGTDALSITDSITQPRDNDIELDCTAGVVRIFVNHVQHATAPPCNAIASLSINAGNGADTVDTSALSPAAVTPLTSISVSLGFNGGLADADGSNTFRGGPFAELVSGSRGNEEINTAGGNDTITATRGIDNLVAGDGTDTLDVPTGGDVTLTNSRVASFTGQLPVVTLTSADITGFEFATITSSLAADGADEKIDASAFSGTATIDAGPGQDIVLASAVGTVAGGEGTDRLQAPMPGFNGGGPALLTDTSLSRGVFTRTFSGFEELWVTGLGGLGGPRDVIDATATTVPVRLDGLEGPDELRGGHGPATLVGGEGDDTLLLGPGGGVAYGDVGNDVIPAGSGPGSRTVNAGPGNDALTTGSTPATVNGDEGSDSIDLGPGGGTANGGADDDDISFGPGADAVDGGAGRDRADVDITAIAGADAATATAVGDEPLAQVEELIVRGTDGADQFDATAFPQRLVFQGGAGNDVLLGGPGDDRCEGGDGADRCDLGDGRDEMAGGDGDDAGIGGPGDDSLDGQGGADDLQGGAGSDALEGGDGNDTIDGGEGDDTITASAGRDTVRGGPGNDVLVMGVDPDAADGGDGNDKLDGGDGDDALTGGPGDDELTGGPGAETFEQEPGADRVDGGEGLDTIRYSAATPVTVDLSGLSASGTAGERDFLGGIETGVGGPSNDTLRGGAGAETLDGGAGHDVVDGGAGTDVLRGGTGNDALSAGPGGAGDGDVLDGGDGLDSVSYGAHTDGVTVDLDGQADDGSAGEGDLVGSANEILLGSSKNDRLIAGQGQPTGTRGRLTVLAGLGGNDTLTGGPDGEALGGGTGDDTVDGGGGNDAVHGGSGNDTIDAGDGNDRVYGQRGVDSIKAGLGQDLVFALDLAKDRINCGEGADQVYQGAGDRVQGSCEDSDGRSDAAKPTAPGGQEDGTDQTLIDADGMFGEGGDSGPDKDGDGLSAFTSADEFSTDFAFDAAEFSEDLGFDFGTGFDDSEFGLEGFDDFGDFVDDDLGGKEPPAATVITKTSPAARGRVPLTVACPRESTGRCFGELVATKPGTTRTLGTSLFTINRGKRMVSRLRLNASGRKALARAKRRRLKVELTLNGRDRGTGLFQSTKRVTVTGGSPARRR